MNNPSTPIKFVSSVATKSIICVVDVSRPLNYNIVTMTCGSDCDIDDDLDEVTDYIVAQQELQDDEDAFPF